MKIFQKKANKLYILILWILLLAIVIFATYNQHNKKAAGPEQYGEPTARYKMMLDMQGKYIVGLQYLLKTALSATPLLEGTKESVTSEEVLRELDLKPEALADQVYTIPLVGEMQGKEKALSRLREIRRDITGTKKARMEGLAKVEAQAKALERLYGKGEKKLTQEEKDLLKKRFRWYYDLALVNGVDNKDPRRETVMEPAIKIVAALAGLSFVFTAALVTGIIFFILGIIRAAKGTLFQNRVWPRAKKEPEKDPDKGIAFFEAFILYLGILLIMQIFGDSRPRAYTLIIYCLMPLTLLWILLRGESRKQLMRGIGFVRGKGIIREMISGIIGYLAGMPIVIGGAIITFVLTELTGIYPVHPIVYTVENSGGIQLVLLVAFASVIGPIMEEVFFRGNFYYYLRGRFGIIFSAGITGLMFAAIHPQGILAIPVLMAIGINLALLREWRGSLIASMTAHGFSNFTVMCITMVIL
ncbi:MAG: CPBP family intramembrane metalloprotease [bacterium]|nr:CPBP family intramembrane metalloprotease [bacterium]